ncbi:DUF4468 domain-containing protein [Dyadobacter sp. CY323]|uniref:DUF4468 domain-containing protein n=1 Tax=Dyadobacter sp. CY323 TaxID=2907302 RepID=UPI001F1AB2DB|nr:DUF4468 domain-containing protein [Dyadobacter sp. CY323]MCE6991363.1 DUF4468 domain-containing protein [Dyadobacter sp. CY323]
MKNTVISLLLLFVSSYSFAQEGLLPLDQEKNIYYADSGKPNLAKAEVYKKVQEWVIKTFGNYENAVAFEDSASGKLRVTSYVPLIHAKYGYVRFDLTIECQDNQYYAKITNLDGISAVHSPERLTYKENDQIKSKEVILKAETAKKRRSELEADLKLSKADNEGINTALYNLLAGLKQALI